MSDKSFYKDIYNINSNIMSLGPYMDYVYFSNCGLESMKKLMEYYSIRIVRNLNAKGVIRKNNVLKSVRKEFFYDTFLHTKEYVETEYYGLMKKFSKTTIKNLMQKSNINYKKFTKDGFNAFNKTLIHICQTIIIKLQFVSREIFNYKIINSFVIKNTKYNF